MRRHRQIAKRTNDQSTKTSFQTTNSTSSLWGGLAAVSPDSKGSQWFLGSETFARDNHFKPPNGPSRGYGNFTGGGAFTASSRHPGGVNVLFADGSTRFVKSTVNVQAWWALGTRAAGEVVGADQY